MLITLLTDFGTSDYFVGAMKGAILYVNPEARIFDLTHEIPPHDIHTGAFTLLAAHKTFPPQTIHVAVVDPGVGSQRRPLLIHAGAQFFIGPDNGLFSFLFNNHNADVKVFQLTNEKYFRHPVSTTFHGRDIFAPVAGALSKGVRPEELGTEIDDYLRLDLKMPARKDDDTIEASIIHIDRFGNCITNLTTDDISDEMFERGARILINDVEITEFRRFYAQSDDGSGELFVIWGSAGFLEIVAFLDSAARRLGVERGQRLFFIGPTTSSSAKE
ncbi:MAG: SAM-dependent chlorinase/fluorinase [Pyrinomonadaceae bacterium]|nr:SAM-dependent chlorinase/fluorinase [Pyrinomonadaceae bacterium]